MSLLEKENDFLSTDEQQAQEQINQANSNGHHSLKMWKIL